MQDGFAPLRFCLFADPTYAYPDQPVELEVVLANEDVLQPGSYPIRLRVQGSTGIVWEKKLDLVIPTPEAGKLPPLAFPVWKGKVTLPSGTYTWLAEMLKGATPAGGSMTFRVAERLPKMDLPPVTCLHLPANVVDLLTKNGAVVNTSEDPKDWQKIVLVGLLSDPEKDPQIWQALEEHARASGRVILLDPASPLSWGERLPFGIKGHVNPTRDWLYHKEYIARPHGLWDGLPSKGILDWEIFTPAIPRVTIVCEDTPDDIASVSFAMGFSIICGYISGVDYAGYKLGKGWVHLNGFRIVPSVSESPASDRMLLNMVMHAGRQ
jgi:hypothetical protein